MDNRPDHSVSVIIPVFNDSERLQSCLQALKNQTYPADCFEVIVVDNGSSEPLLCVPRRFDNVIFVQENKKGSYAARNKGLSIAKNEVIAFTDSDCIPASDWIEKGVKNLTGTNNCGLVAGKIEFFFKNKRYPTASEIYDGEHHLKQQKYVEKHHFGATANLFTYRHVFDSVGLFNDNLLSGGDDEWGIRVHAAGYQQVYAEDAIVLHPTRSFCQLKNKIIRIYRGNFAVYGSKRYGFLDFIIDIKPPFRSFCRNAIKNEKLNSSTLKIKYMFLLFFLHYLVVFEKFKYCLKR